MPLASNAQYDDAWFFLRAKEVAFQPEFTKVGDKLVYKGADTRLKNILAKYDIFQFKKTYRKAKKENLKKTFFVRANQKELMNDLLKNASHIFTFGEHIAGEDKKIFEPNDYGLTSTIGENLGAQVNLDYLDFLNVPKAWYYTTGNPDIIVGISDAYLDTTNIEFKGRTSMVRRSGLAQGHGYTVGETAVGNGDNAYAIPGICYNCDVLTTQYGKFRTLETLMELSRMGTKVINCSWVGTRYYETAQQAVDEMFENGTIIVAAAGNSSFNQKKGKVRHYPASYDKVIAVSAAMHRYEDYRENIKIELKNGRKLYYAENIAGYIGRTAGFPDNDTLQDPFIHRASTRTFNDKIDILTPSVDIFRYSKLVLNDSIVMDPYSHTSGVTPMVTGTVGLMFSLYPCLPADEVESILKMTSWNIDHIPANKPFKGLYGSGMLKTGDAVEMVYKLYNENEVATIQNQDFKRWDFKVRALSKELRIQNQIFRDSTSLEATAKQRIVIGKNTRLKPNRAGKIHLKIDPTLQKDCDFVLRDPSILNN